MVEYGIFAAERCWLLMDGDGAPIQGICRVCPSEFFTLEEPVRMLGSTCVLECSRVMGRSCVAIRVVDNPKRGWYISDLGHTSKPQPFATLN